MRVLSVIKRLPVPTILCGGIYAGYNGEFPIFKDFFDTQLAQIDIAIFEAVKHPTAFLIFCSLAVAWVFHTLLTAILFGRKQRALVLLGKVWEEGTDFKNTAASKRIISGEDSIIIKNFENSIFENVSVVSPPEESLFRQTSTVCKTDHSQTVWPEFCGGDDTLLIFSERLFRVGEFIKKHTTAE